MSEKSLALKIIVNPYYMTEQSDPNIHKFVWAYDIEIINTTDHIIQLLNRYWHITDMLGRIEEIHGTGVVGLQPLIKPDRSFKYTSYCQLMTPQGTMEGYYGVQDLTETQFKVEIPKFILSTPSALSQLFREKLH